MFIFHFAAMSRRIGLKKLGEKVEKAKGESLAKKSTPVKGVVIGEKRPMDEPSISPSKKAKPGDNPKGKEPAIAPEPKRKTTGLDDRPRAPTSSARYYPGYARIFFLLRYIFAWFDPKRFDCIQLTKQLTSNMVHL